MRSRSQKAVRRALNTAPPANTRIAVLILYDREGRMLLQHRCRNAPNFPGFWAFFGGHIRKHETPLEAARREGHEELRANLTRPRLLDEYLVWEYGSWLRLFVFIAEYRSDKHRLVLGEGQGWEWLDAKGIVKKHAIPHDLCIILDAGVVVGWDKASRRLLQAKIARATHEIFSKWKASTKSRRAGRRQGRGSRT